MMKAYMMGMDAPPEAHFTDAISPHNNVNVNTPKVHPLRYENLQKINQNSARLPLLAESPPASPHTVLPTGRSKRSDVTQFLPLVSKRDESDESGRPTDMRKAKALTAIEEIQRTKGCMYNKNSQLTALSHPTLSTKLKNPHAFKDEYMNDAYQSNDDDVLDLVVWR